TTADTSPAQEGGATACEGDAKCGVGKVRKLKNRRAANEGAIIGALPLGRVVLLAPEPSAAAPNPTDAANSDGPTPADGTPRGPRERRRRCERRRARLVATIGRASGDCPPRNGARRPMRRTTVTCAVAMTSHGAGPGKARRRDQLNPTHRDA